MNLINFRSDGFFGYLYLHILTDAQNDAIVLHSGYCTENAAKSFYSGSLFQSLYHLVVLFLFLSLRCDQQKVEGNENKNHGQKRHKASAPLLVASGSHC